MAVIGRCFVAVLTLFLLAGCGDVSGPWFLKIGPGLINSAPNEGAIDIFAGERVDFEAEVSGGIEPFTIAAYGPTREGEELLVSTEGKMITFYPGWSGRHRILLRDNLGQEAEWTVDIGVIAFGP